MSNEFLSAGSDRDLTQFVAALDRRLTPEEIQRFLTSDVRTARLYNKAFDKNSNEASYIDITLHMAHQIVRQLLADIADLKGESTTH